MEIDDDRKAQIIQDGVQSLFWSEVLVPMLAERYMGAIGRALAGRGSLSDGEIRGLLGDAANAQWIRSWPETALKQYYDEQEERIERQREEEEAEQRAEYRAEHGMSAVMPQPGDEEV